MPRLRFILTRIPVGLLALLFLMILALGGFTMFLTEVASDILTGIQNRMYALNRWCCKASGKDR